MRIRHLIAAASLSLALLILPAASSAQISLSINIAPPPIPVYEPPPPPEPSYIWTPGYWAYGLLGYFWVPGTWVVAPEPGLLWTPGYWGWRNGLFAFNQGYWGHHVGFYGGIDYGYGYNGHGFNGGGWRNNQFVNAPRETIINNNTTINNVSFNGGPGGINARPTPNEQMAMHEHHVPPTHMQAQHVSEASHNHGLLASVNHGKPAIAATQRPGVFFGRGVVAARQSGARNVQAEKHNASAQQHNPAMNNRTTVNEESRPQENVRPQQQATQPHPPSSYPAAQRHPEVYRGNGEPHNAPAQPTQEHAAQQYPHAGHNAPPRATPHPAPGAHPAPQEHREEHPEGEHAEHL